MSTHVVQVTPDKTAQSYIEQATINNFISEAFGEVGVYTNDGRAENGHPVHDALIVYAKALEVTIVEPNNRQHVKDLQAARRQLDQVIDQVASHNKEAYGEETNEAREQLSEKLAELEETTRRMMKLEQDRGRGWAVHSSSAG